MWDDHETKDGKETNGQGVQGAWERYGRGNTIAVDKEMKDAAFVCTFPLLLA